MMPPSNDSLAEKLELVSTLFWAQGANRFRAKACHPDAETLGQLETPAWQIYKQDGIEGLDESPKVRRAISGASVPEMGPKLAQQIHAELEIETLAARGRYPFAGGSQMHLLDNVHDLGSEILIAELRGVDDEYHFRAADGSLPRATPLRFDPRKDAWFPILQTERGDRQNTALFSNTEHAHAMGTRHHWVVIYLENHDKGDRHGRGTVITSQFERLKRKRIIREREKYCAEYYKNRAG